LIMPGVREPALIRWRRFLLAASVPKAPVRSTLRARRGQRQAPLSSPTQPSLDHDPDRRGLVGEPGAPIIKTGVECLRMMRKLRNLRPARLAQKRARQGGTSRELGRLRRVLLSKVSPPS
jgi:hypothetical protein